MVGGVVSLGGGYGVTYYLVNYVPQSPPNSIRALYTSVGWLFINMFLGGLVGGFLHRLLAARSSRGAGLVSIKWGCSCVFVFVVVTITLIAFPVLNGILSSGQARIGPYGLSTLLSAMFGLIISAILGDTRPRRGDRPPSP